MEKYYNSKISPKSRLFVYVMIAGWVLYCMYYLIFKSDFSSLFWLLYPLFSVLLLNKKVWIDEATRTIRCGYRSIKFGRTNLEIDKITSIRIGRTPKGRYRNLEVRSGQYRFIEIEPNDYEAFINEVQSLNNSIEILNKSSWANH
jgi:hypothetical protein